MKKGTTQRQGQSTNQPFASPLNLWVESLDVTM